MELKQHTITSDASDSSDSDFEEVEEKDGYEKTANQDVPVCALSTGTVFGIKKCHTTADNQSSWNICSGENSEMVVFCILSIPYFASSKILSVHTF